MAGQHQSDKDWTSRYIGDLESTRTGQDGEGWWLKRPCVHRDDRAPVKVWMMKTQKWPQYKNVSWDSFCAVYCHYKCFPYYSHFMIVLLE